MLGVGEGSACFIVVCLSRCMSFTLSGQSVVFASAIEHFTLCLGILKVVCPQTCKVICPQTCKVVCP